MHELTSGNAEYKASYLTYIIFFGYWGLSFFESYVNGALGSISKYYIVAVIIYLILSARRFNLSIYNLIVFMWAVYYMSSILWSMNPDQGMTYFFSVLMMAVFVFLIISIRFDDYFIRWTLRTITWWSFFLGFLGLFYSEKLGGSIASREVLTLFGIQIDPNNLCGLYSYGLGLGIYYVLFSDKKPLVKVVYTFFTLSNLYNILRTGSRSGIIVIIALLILALIHKPLGVSEGRTFIKRIVFLILIIVAIYFLIGFLPREVWMRISGQDSNLQFTDSLGRTERWLYGLKLWWNTNPIFGCGWGSFECHGTFFTFIVDVGLIGNILFYSLIISIIYKCIKYHEIQALLVFIAGMVPAFFIGAQNRRFFWNAIIVPIMILNRYSKDDTNEYTDGYNAIESKNEGPI